MKTTVSFVLLLLCVAAVQADWVPFDVENYSFEYPGQGKIKGWDEALGAYYTSGGAPAEVPGWRTDFSVSDSGVEAGSSATGSYQAFLMGSDPSIWQIEPNVIESEDAYKLVVDACAASSISLIIFYYDEQTETRVPMVSESFATTSTYSEYSIGVAASDIPDSVGHRIGIEIDNDQSGWLAVDNVRFYCDSSRVYTISPVSGASSVDVNADLEWQAYGWPVDLYLTTDSGLATDPNVQISPGCKKLSMVSVSTYDPGILQANATYYWKVVAYEPNSTGYTLVETSVSSFTTASGGITISAQPEDAACDEGNTATFTVEANSDSSIHYQWYKTSDDPNVSDRMVGPDAAVLVLENTDPNDEGYYYCVLTNSKGSATTEEACLDVLVLLAHWTFDDTLDEVTGTGLDGVMFSGAVPQYTAGILGNAISVTTADSDFVTVPGTENLFDMNTQDMTIAVWVRTTQSAWGDMVSKCNRSPKTGWTLRHSADYVDSVMQGSSPGSELKYYTKLNDDSWHLAVLTYNAQTAQMTLYATYTDSSGNLQMVSGSTGALTTKTATTVPLRFGVSAALNGGSVGYKYAGLLDDVRIYDYVMTQADIINKLYTPATGQKACTAADFPKDMDLDSDCRIDMADVAILASHWLSSGLYPIAQ